MTTDFEGREPTITPNGDAPLFAANPVWERSRKKKGLFGARKAAAPMAAPEPTPAPEPIPDEIRSFMAEEPAIILDSPIDRPFAAGTGATTTHSTLAADEPLAAPIGRPAAARTVKARNAGPSAAVIAGALAAVALVGVGGWYVMAPRDGVPELAPGQATTSEIAAAPIVTSEPSEVAAATNTLPARVAAPVRAEPRQVAQARVRPAARAPAASAAASGTNVSATVLPDAPQPYTTINPSAAPPAQAAPAPVEAAPAPIPATPAAPAPQEPEATPPVA